MKIETQSRPELLYVARLTQDTPTAMLTTTQAGQVMASRAMAAPESEAHGALWFRADLRSPKVEGLQAVNLCIVDIAHGARALRSGRAEMDTDRRRIERLWAPLAKPWFAGRPTHEAVRRRAGGCGVTGLPTVRFDAMFARSLQLANHGVMARSTRTRLTPAGVRPS